MLLCVLGRDYYVKFNGQLWNQDVFHSWKVTNLKEGMLLKFDQKWIEDVRHWFKSDGSVKDLYENIL
jgi:hypothetical protein